MAISVVGTARNNSNIGSTNISLPAGTAAGDLVIITNDVSPSKPAVPTGLVELGFDTNGGHRHEVSYKVLAGGDIAGGITGDGFVTAIVLRSNLGTLLCTGAGNRDEQGLSVSTTISFYSEFIAALPRPGLLVGEIFCFSNAWSGTPSAPLTRYDRGSVGAGSYDTETYTGPIGAGVPAATSFVGTGGGGGTTGTWAYAVAVYEPRSPFYVPAVML